MMTLREVCGIACQRAARLGATVLPRLNGRLRRPATARRIHIRRRGRVLRNSPPPASVRSANRPEPWPRLAPSGVRRGARGLGLPHAPCAAAPVVFAAIRAAMLRRRDTASSPCDVSHRASDEPRRRMSLSSALAPSSLASPSIRRVFLRSFCARRRPVSELNRAAYPPERSGVAEGELHAECTSAPRVAAPSGCLQQGDMRRLGRGASPRRPLPRQIRRVEPTRLD